MSAAFAWCSPDVFLAGRTPRGPQPGTGQARHHVLDNHARALIYAMHLEGHTQQQIADAVGVSAATISYRLNGRAARRLARDR